MENKRGGKRVSQKQAATFRLEVYSDANSSMFLILFSDAAKQVHN